MLAGAADFDAELPLPTLEGQLLPPVLTGFVFDGVLCWRYIGWDQTIVYEVMPGC